jgi:toxin ParE1/3/4
MKIHWTSAALTDRMSIFTYIAQDRPGTAAAVDARIRSLVEQLARFPHRGRPGRVPDSRELVIANTPYLAIYRIHGHTLSILRILHGSQCWPV